ncbi:putative Appr-1-p processing protein [Erwinia phage vB_EamM_Caitlin]|uniref:putative Appr-1-p processing protein n=1 Tax=Erwinia phage vB_EamM_Caitlin TaxID=1883379 RepID=UPI00081C4827|nr:putative Appr-1-p processing protein [Erwinia phage vB_EamM_Caitlin]ANZ48501.1 putative Appr-1-p processing protein [Erwinia phage vB_EamM_Caitlin]
MIIFRDEQSIAGDLFNAKEVYKVVTINCVGAMGKGIALACKERFPKIYEDYRLRCKQNEIMIGNVYLYEDEKIILLPTKTHFKYRSEIAYVTTGIDALARLGHDLNEDVALPPLGMANGWLREYERAIIYRHLYDALNSGERNYRIYLPKALMIEAKKTLL